MKYIIQWASGNNPKSGAVSDWPERTCTYDAISNQDALRKFRNNHNDDCYIIMDCYADPISEAMNGLINRR